MTKYKQASEVLEKNQKAIVLFTHGDDVSYDSAGNGSTGKWVVNPDIGPEQTHNSFFSTQRSRHNQIKLARFCQRWTVPGQLCYCINLSEDSMICSPVDENLAQLHAELDAYYARLYGPSAMNCVTRPAAWIPKKSTAKISLGRRSAC